MTDIASDGEAVAAAPRAALLNPLAIPSSLVVHAVIILLLASVATIRQLPRLAAPPGIDVEIISELEYEDAFEIPPDVAIAPLAVPTVREEPDAAAPAPADGMKQATELFASRVLTDPANRQVRDTLPLLEETERITQLCNIEGLEQLHKAMPEPFPDSISPSAFAPTMVRGYKLEASAAAYRAARRWYRLRFTCTVSSDFSGVWPMHSRPETPSPRRNGKPTTSSQRTKTSSYRSTVSDGPRRSHGHRSG